MKNLMKTMAIAALLLATTSCGMYDLAGKRSDILENLHKGMTKEEVIAELGKPEFKRFDADIEQWEYHKLHYLGEQKTIIVLDFHNGRLVTMDSYDGNYPLPPVYPPVAICPPAPEGHIPAPPPALHDDAWFQEIYGKVQNDMFDDDRLKTVRSAAKKHKFTGDQAVQLLKLFTFDDDRLKALQALAPRISGPYDIDQIIDTMDFIGSEQKVRNILKAAKK